MKTKFDLKPIYGKFKIFVMNQNKLGFRNFQKVDLRPRH